VKIITTVQCYIAILYTMITDDKHTHMSNRCTELWPVTFGRLGFYVCLCVFFFHNSFHFVCLAYSSFFAFFNLRQEVL